MPQKQQSQGEKGEDRQISQNGDTHSTNNEAPVPETSSHGAPIQATFPAFLPEFLDQLVSQVADKATKQLGGPSVRQTAPPSTSQAGGSQLAEVSIIGTTVADQTPTNRLAGSIVQGSVDAVHQAISGIASCSPVRSNIFTSCDLPIDARILDKLLGKIFNNSFILGLSFQTHS